MFSIVKVDMNKNNFETSRPYLHVLCTVKPKPERIRYHITSEINVGISFVNNEEPNVAVYVTDLSQNNCLFDIHFSMSYSLHILFLLKVFVYMLVLLFRGALQAEMPFDYIATVICWASLHLIFFSEF